MREKRQTSGAEEFQVTYVDILHKSPRLRCGLYIVTSEENSDTHYLSQEIKVNIKSHKPW